MEIAQVKEAPYRNVNLNIWKLKNAIKHIGNETYCSTISSYSNYSFSHQLAFV